jgi:hypothetical protein
MNTVTNREREKGGPITADLAAFAEMPPAQQEVKRDLNKPVLNNRNAAMDLWGISNSFDSDALAWLRQQDRTLGG